MSFRECFGIVFLFLISLWLLSFVSIYKLNNITMINPAVTSEGMY